MSIFPISRQRRGPASLLLLRCLIAAAPLVGTSAPAQGVHVWTYRNDNARTGRNTSETALSPATVDKDHFGKLFSLAVDGDVYAQPLYLSGLTAGGKVRNVVFVATEHDSVFAFDADNGAKLWSVSFLTASGAQTLTSSDLSGCGDIGTEVGITGTPVIDVAPTLTDSTLFVVSKAKEGPAGACVQRLHALDVTSGAEKFGGPATISASVRGTGNGSDRPADFGTPGDNDGRGNVGFQPLRQNQRSGLLLVDRGGGRKAVFIAWAGHCDITPYHGWLMGYDAGNLQQVAVFNTTPNGGRGGIWQSGAAPAADAAGNIYFSTGNGTFDVELDRSNFPRRADYGDSVVRLTADPTTTPASPGPNGWGVKVADYFTPFDETALGIPPEDFDLGSGGVLLLDDQTVPPAHLLTLAGKKGVIYLINRDNMGKYNPASDTTLGRCIQRLPSDPCDVSPIGDLYGMPALLGDSLYFVGAPPRDHMGTPIGGPAGTDALKQFKLAAGRIVTPPASRTAVGFAWKTCPPVVSSNGTTGGIVWIIRAEGYLPAVPATLHAIDAAVLSRELYNSDQAVKPDGSKRDQPGIGIKFVVPTVANGKVYVGTKNEVDVYGKL
jgi:outer membrane protein assembly factor BamB